MCLAQKCERLAPQLFFAARTRPRPLCLSAVVKFLLLVVAENRRQVLRFAHSLSANATSASLTGSSLIFG